MPFHSNLAYPTSYIWHSVQCPWAVSLVTEWFTAHHNYILCGLIHIYWEILWNIFYSIPRSSTARLHHLNEDYYWLQRLYSVDKFQEVSLRDMFPQKMCLFPIVDKCFTIGSNSFSLDCNTSLAAKMYFWGTLFKDAMCQGKPSLVWVWRF